ncbi:MAG: winged helix-turn-helix transcriptional regulator, partial [Promethearchaeota archaeon]
REKFKYRNKWNAFLEFNMNNSVNSIKISIKKSQLNHIDDEDKFAIYNPNDENWLILDTYSADGFIICQLNLSDLPFNPADPNNDNNNDNNNHIPSTSADPPSEASEYSIFLSVFHEEPLSFIELPVFKVLIVIGLIVAIISGVMSKTEYREFILNRIMNFQPRQRLSIEKVLENKNRKLIIDLIIDNPGIHFNELLRETGLSPGNLVWHLDILEEYKIIGKKNAGNYLIYFPYYMDNPISNIDFDLMKSKTTIAILNKIKETPGTYNNEIAKSLKLDHKTVKYHLDKLLEKGLIVIKKEGRKKRIYPRSENIN